jgi:hypothetical protein
MTAPDKIAEYIGLLSDTEMYQKAISLTKNTSKIDSISKTQFLGLMEFSRSWSDLNNFVKHQKERDWKEKEAYKVFFNGLHTFLCQLRNDVKEKYKLVSSNLTKAESKNMTDLYAGLLARSFIQHLSAEMLYRGKISRD